MIQDIHTPQPSLRGTDSTTSNILFKQHGLVKTQTAACQQSQIYHPQHGLNALITAAMPVFSLVGRAELLVVSSDAVLSTFNQSLRDELEAFASQASKQGYDLASISAAHYCLCAFIDDRLSQVTGERWDGSDHPRGFLASYHQSGSNEQVSLLLDYYQQAPKQFIDMLELIYLVFLLGYEGPFNQSAALYKQRLHIMEELHQQITQIRQAFCYPLMEHSHTSSVNEPDPAKTSKTSMKKISISAGLALTLGLIIGWLV